MADAFHHRHIVGNKQEGDAKLALQVEHQINNLRLNRHIQRRDGLVGNHHFGVQRQRAGYTDALTLPARKFMRITLSMFRQQSHFIQQPGNALLRLATRHRLVDQQRLHNGEADRQPGIQRGVGILEDKLNITPQMGECST